MRKRRVIIFDGDPATAGGLRKFFEARGYEIMVFRDTAICPVVDQRNGRCPGNVSCCDITIIRHDMPSMNGIDLLAAQQRRGCKLSAVNKAIVARGLDAEDRLSLDVLGAPFFLAPIDLGAFGAWVAQCEEGMDLERPVAIRRKEDRRATNDEWMSLLLRGEEVDRVSVVNKSSCGVCFRTVRALEPNQMLTIRSDSHETTEDATVRWVRRDRSGSYLVGLCYCV